MAAMATPKQCGWCGTSETREFVSIFDSTQVDAAALAAATPDPLLHGEWCKTCRQSAARSADGGGARLPAIKRRIAASRALWKSEVFTSARNGDELHMTYQSSRSYVVVSLYTSTSPPVVGDGDAAVQHCDWGLIHRDITAMGEAAPAAAVAAPAAAAAVAPADAAAAFPVFHDEWSLLVHVFTTGGGVAVALMRPALLAADVDQRFTGASRAAVTNQVCASLLDRLTATAIRLCRGVAVPGAATERRMSLANTAIRIDDSKTIYARPACQVVCIDDECCSDCQVVQRKRSAVARSEQQREAQRGKAVAAGSREPVDDTRKPLIHYSPPELLQRCLVLAHEIQRQKRRQLTRREQEERAIAHFAASERFRLRFLATVYRQAPLQLRLVLAAHSAVINEAATIGSAEEDADGEDAQASGGTATFVSVVSGLIVRRNHNRAPVSAELREFCHNLRDSSTSTSMVQTLPAKATLAAAVMVMAAALVRRERIH
jgi:hypothetical protein